VLFRTESEPGLDHHRQADRGANRTDDLGDQARIAQQGGSGALGHDLAHRAAAVYIDRDKTAELLHHARSGRHRLRIGTVDMPDQRGLVGVLADHVHRDRYASRDRNRLHDFGVGQRGALQSADRAHGAIGVAGHRSQQQGRIDPQSADLKRRQ